MHCTNLHLTLKYTAQHYKALHTHIPPPPHTHTHCTTLQSTTHTLHYITLHCKRLHYLGVVWYYATRALFFYITFTGILRYTTLHSFTICISMHSTGLRFHCVRCTSTDLRTECHCYIHRSGHSCEIDMYWFLQYHRLRIQSQTWSSQQL